ncbi:MAG TPA: hypothetical protein VED41_10170 [Solirubrobacteraceae bacterium]|nr:hypothetical protein [Solirubrobacteraceae bacterium]
MAPQAGPPKQLEIPLRWDHDPGAPARATEGEPGGGAGRPGRAPLARLWLGILADLGAILLAVGACWTLAALAGASLRAAQLVAGGVAGIEIGGVLLAACLWGWRGSPGMLLVGLTFARPISFARVVRLSLAWIGSLPVAGVPLLVRRSGLCVAERLGGSAVSSHSPRAGA